jgi:hydroxyethylthiazole kinase-like uncharacterized protein yjeF
MVSGLPADRRGEIVSLSRDVAAAAAEADAVLVGPGMDAAPATQRIAAAILRRAKAVVLDAGALGGAMTSSRAGELVLTPHFGEMAALLDVDKEEVEANPIAMALALAQQIDAIVVLKSADTAIAHADGHVWVHTGGSAGLGTSGSGDVLAGVICGLMAQGATPEQASVWGVALHGRAGEALSRDIGHTGFLAREIARRIPAIRDALQ